MFISKMVDDNKSFYVDVTPFLATNKFKIGCFFM